MQLIPGEEQSSATMRPAAPDNAGAVRDLVRAAYTHYVPRLGREPGSMRDDYV